MYSIELCENDNVMDILLGLPRGNFGAQCQPIICVRSEKCFDILTLSLFVSVFRFLFSFFFFSFFVTLSFSLFFFERLFLGSSSPSDLFAQFTVHEVTMTHCLRKFFLPNKREENNQCHSIVINRMEFFRSVFKMNCLPE